MRWRVYACYTRPMRAFNAATYDLSTKIKSLDINLVVSEAHLNFCSTQTRRPSSLPVLHDPFTFPFTTGPQAPGHLSFRSVLRVYDFLLPGVPPKKSPSRRLKAGLEPLPESWFPPSRPFKHACGTSIARGIRVANFYSVKNPAGATPLSLSPPFRRVGNGASAASPLPLPLLTRERERNSRRDFITYYYFYYYYYICTSSRLEQTDISPRLSTPGE